MTPDTQIKVIVQLDNSAKNIKSFVRGWWAGGLVAGCVTEKKKTFFFSGGGGGTGAGRGEVERQFVKNVIGRIKLHFPPPPPQTPLLVSDT